MANHDYLQIINAAISAVIVIRLMLFKRNGAEHKPLAGWIAYAVIVTCASVPIRTALGYQVMADWSDVLIKMVLCGAVLMTRGNIMQIFKGSR